MEDKFGQRIKALLSGQSILKDGELYFDVSGISPMRTGGKCTLYLKANRREELISLFGILAANNINEWYVIGDCTNILFNDGQLDLILIKPGEDFNYIRFAGNSIEAGSSYSLQKFVVQAAKRGYDFSFLAGIPGTVGGAVLGNSGTSKKGINDFVSGISYIFFKDKKTGLKKISINKQHFAYRDFNIDGLAVLTDILFDIGRMEKKTKTLSLCSREIFKKIRENIKNKKRSQPLGTNNIGCFFKNPQKSGITAAMAIDRCKLKGFKFGGARISARHANFIENFSNSSSKDILVLSKIAREFVKNKFNLELDYEIRMVGF